MLLVTMQSHCQSVKVKSAKHRLCKYNKIMIQVSTFNSQKLKTAYVDCVWPMSTFHRWSWTDCVSCQ